ncbi:NACHT domain-containing protein [Nonomuraea sp. NPDC059023]|uniref:NACHT N-terminal Helical domain 1-containing protein n=1 Tax=unclassified Nonomuraea TaxID=2593643 RepID=UPI0036A392DD
MAVDDRNKRLANQIMLSVFRVLFPGAATRAQGISDMANLVFTRQDERRARDTFEHRLTEARDLLVERLRRFEQVEFRNLDAAERDLAVDGVCRALESARLDRSALAKSRFDVEEIAAPLRPEARRHWRRAHLSSGAHDYGEWFLHFSCQYVVALAKSMPDFQAELSVDTFVLALRTYELLEDAINGVILPHFRPRTPREMSAFEALYLADIIHTYKNMELFGLDLPMELKRQPIEIAYITLTAEEENARAGPVDERIAQIVKNSTRSNRILIVGTAGSGKTTISQWLAVCAARHSFPPVLRVWNGLIPFVVQLRNVFSGSEHIYPTRDDLIKAASHRRKDVPTGWITSTLESGKALVILDGLDELSELHRSDFSSWLEKLLDEYPDVRYVVTSRPEGANMSWFAGNRFSPLRLHPMDDGRIILCVNAWFDSFLLFETQERRDYFRDRRQDLLRDLRRRITVREIAETPLLCAMLCAFYADNLSDTAPSSRSELYNKVISALAWKRERARAPRGVGLELNEQDRLDLLEAVACHLSEHSAIRVRMEDLRLREQPRPTVKTPGALTPAERPELRLPEKTVLEIVKECLPGMMNVTIGARDVMKILVNRTIVFRETSAGVAEFAHRSFQEYLTALGYAHAGRTGDLTRHITDDGWHRVIAFAAAELDRPSASRLVGGILDAADEAADDRRRVLLLLAAECISTGRRVTTAIAERAGAALTDVLPPRTIEEAELIGGSEGMVRWLTRFTGEPPPTQEACVHAAAVLGGDEGLEVIARYAPLAREQRVVDEIVACGERFEIGEYVDRVLSRMSLAGVVVHVRSEALLGHVGRLTELTALDVAVGQGALSLASWRGLSKLVQLDCGKHKGPVSLAGIEKLTALRRLSLRGVPGVNRLRALTGLEELHLDGCNKLTDLAPLADLRKLRILILDGCVNARGFAALRALRDLRTLSINGCKVGSLSFCREMPALTTLRALTREGVSKTSALEECENLQRLELRLAGFGRETFELPGGERLRSLKLTGTVLAADLMTLTNSPRLLSLHAEEVENLMDLTCLSGLTYLRKLALTGCRELSGCGGIANLVHLTELDLSGSRIEHLDFLTGLRSLRRLRLDDCTRLHSLLALRDLPDLQHVSLRGSPLANPDAIDSLRNVVVDYEPYDYDSVITPDTVDG